MKKRIIALVMAAFLLSALFAGCGRRDFKRVEVPTTTAPSTEVQTEPANQAEEGAFTFAANIKMGMTIAEMQAAVGQVSEITIQDNRKSLSNEFSGIFINYSTTKSVIFMFDQETERLEQMQFRCSTAEDGANTAAAVALFDIRYGKNAVYQSKYLNHIWRSEDVYILLSELNENEYAVTYTESSYFESNYEEEAAAYERVQ